VPTHEIALPLQACECRGIGHTQSAVPSPRLTCIQSPQKCLPIYDPKLGCGTIHSPVLAARTYLPEAHNLNPENAAAASTALA
jgi:hypothetical protein